MSVQVEMYISCIMNWFDTLWLLQVHNSSSPDLVISPVQLTDAGFYICRVNCGDSFEFSQWAQVDVLNVATPYGETLSFTSQSVHGQHCYYVFLLPGIFGIWFLSGSILIRLTFSTRCQFLLSVKDRQNRGEFPEHFVALMLSFIPPKLSLNSPPERLHIE